MFHQHTLMLKPILEAIGVTQPVWLGVAAVGILVLMFIHLSQDIEQVED